MDRKRLTSEKHIKPAMGVGKVCYLEKNSNQNAPFCMNIVQLLPKKADFYQLKVLL